MPPSFNIRMASLMNSGSFGSPIWASMKKQMKKERNTIKNFFSIYTI
jgi:hypothetical protein